MSDFLIGCNYWDSVSGTDMWRNWNEQVIEKDLTALQECGVRCLRVFPNWRDFQPVAKLRTQGGNFREYVNLKDERRLDPCESGIDQEMVKRFRRFVELADSHDIKLIVAVMTGWMSARLFTPPVLDDRNVLTDPEALMWTEKFINGFVSSVKDLENILMWDLGNECNCMGKVTTRSEAYTWAAFVRNAIWRADNSRMIASGMHGLSAEETGPWTIEDQGSLCDMLTTHPYPMFIGGDVEPYNKMRATVLPTAQSVYYSGVGGKPCMMQEIGTFTRTNGNLEMSAQFLRVNVLSAWANGLTGFLWWCGAEHTKLNQAPYRWTMMERQLGLLDVDRQPKPVGLEMAKMQKVMETLPVLPPKQEDVICVLPCGPKENKATSAFILAQQAGFQIGIRRCNTAIPEGEAYIVPCIEGGDVIDKRTLDFLLDRIENHGAKCLFTYDGGEFINFEEIFGLSSCGIYKSGTKHTAAFSFGELTYHTENDIHLKSVGAEVLAKNEEDSVVFSRNRFGKGSIYFLAFPLEKLANATVNGYDPSISQPYFQIYRLFAGEEISSYIVRTENPYIGITQHQNGDESCYITVINYADQAQIPVLDIQEGWEIQVLYGTANEIPACDGVVLHAKFVG